MCGFYCCFLQGKWKPLSRPPSCGCYSLQAFCESHAWLLPLPTPWISQAFSDTGMLLLGQHPLRPWKVGLGCHSCVLSLELILISSWDALMSSLPRAFMSGPPWPGSVLTSHWLGLCCCLWGRKGYVRRASDGGRVGRPCLLIWVAGCGPSCIIKGLRLLSDLENLGVRLRLDWGQGVKTLSAGTNPEVRIADSNFSFAVYKVCAFGQVTESLGVSVF